MVGLRVANIYDLSSRIFLFKIAKPGTRHQLIADVGFRCHLTNFVRSTATTPSPFVSRLRKYLKSRRITAIGQIGTDRVIEIVFSGGLYHLFLEFFAAGNIILTDSEHNILALFRNVSEGKEEVDVKLGARYQLAARYIPTQMVPVTDARVREVLENQLPHIRARRIINTKKAKRKSGDELKSSLARGFSEYPMPLLDHAFQQTSCDSSLTVEQALENAELLSKVTQAVQTADAVFESLSQPEQPQGYIIAKAKGSIQETSQVPDSQEVGTPERDQLLYDDFHPFRPCQFEHTARTYIIERSGFNKTVDEFYSSLESQKLESRLADRQDNAKRKIELARQQHHSRIGALQEVQELHIRKAEAIQSNAYRVEEVIAAVNSLIGQGMDWGDIAKLIGNEQGAENPVAQLIKLPLKLYENTVTVLLEEVPADDADEDEDDDETYDSEDAGDSNEDAAQVDADKDNRRRQQLAIDLDLSLSAWANARVYYEQKRNAAQKEQKTVQASTKALKGTEQKITADLKKGLKQEKDVLRPARKQFWFEKFWYFVSSEGYLVLSGKDTQQNDLLYQRHLKKGDVYVHADLPGAASVVVKNFPSMPEAPIPPSTLSQAGTLAVCTSTAWDSKAVMAAWWVNAAQVSKTAPTGEYLASEGFVIKGNKNFLPPAQLLLGFSSLFCISAESKARHHKRSVGNVDEQGNTSQPEVVVGKANSCEDHGPEPGLINDDDDDPMGRVKQFDFNAEDVTAGPGMQGEDADSGENDTDETDRLNNGAASINPLQPQVPILAEEIKKLELTGRENDHHAAEAQNKAIPATNEITETQDDELRLNSLSGRTEVARDVEKPAGVADEPQLPENTEVQNPRSVSRHAGTDGSMAKMPEEDHGPTRRGKNTKASKRARARYAEQDPEERALAMQLLGATKSQQKKETAANEKADQSAKLAADRQRRRLQHEKAADREKKRMQQLSATGTDVAASYDEGEGDNDNKNENDLTGLSTLVSDPHPRDDILFAIPHVAPWSALVKAKYKVKLQPGGLKKGKAVREIVGRWIESGEKQRQKRVLKTSEEKDDRMDQTAVEDDNHKQNSVLNSPTKAAGPDDASANDDDGQEDGKRAGQEVDDMEEQDNDKEIAAIKAWRLEEVFGCLPVGGVRIVAGPAGGHSGRSSRQGGGGNNNNNNNKNKNTAKNQQTKGKKNGGGRKKK